MRPSNSSNRNEMEGDPSRLERVPTLTRKHKFMLAIGVAGMFMSGNGVEAQETDDIGASFVESESLVPVSKLPAGQTICVDTNAQKGDLVEVTATVTEPIGPGFANISSREASANGGWRNTSGLNFLGGQTIANSLGVIAGDSGEICATSLTDTHFILDVAGATRATAVTFENPDGSPSRSLDTRIDIDDNPNNGLTLIEKSGDGVIKDKQIIATCMVDASSPSFPIKRVLFSISDVPFTQGVVHDTTRITSSAGNGGMAFRNQNGFLDFSSYFFPSFGEIEPVDRVRGVTTLWVVEAGRFTLDKAGLPYTKFVFDLHCDAI